MIKSLLTFLLLLSVLHPAFAQTRLITGTIRGDSLPLPGVSVNVKGTSIGTTSKMDGKYSWYGRLRSR